MCPQRTSERGAKHEHFQILPEDERIADANAEILKRQLQDIRQGEEGCRQGNLKIRRLQGVEISDVLGRKQIQANRLVTEAGASASRCLPVTAKADLMQGLLPAYNIIQVIAPAKEGDGSGTPNSEILTQRDRGRAHPEARGTLRRLRRTLGETNKKIGEAQVVTTRAPSCDVNPRCSGRPIPSAAATWKGTHPLHKRSCFVRVAHEHQLPLGKFEVRPGAELIYVCGAGINATQRSKVRGRGSMFITPRCRCVQKCRRKKPSLCSGASEGQPILPALEERIGMNGSRPGPDRRRGGGHEKRGSLRHAVR